MTPGAAPARVSIATMDAQLGGKQMERMKRRVVAVAGAAAGRWGLDSPFWIALGCVVVATVIVFVIRTGEQAHLMPQPPCDEAAGTRR